MTRKTILVATLLVILVTGTVLGYWWTWGRAEPELRLHGVVEIQEVRLGSKIGGRVLKVEVREGDLVKANQPLVWLDVPELKAQREQLVARRDAAYAELKKAEIAREAESKTREAAREAMRAGKARWERVEKGWREEEKQYAASEQAAARADYQNALREFERIEGLYRARSVAHSEYDTALTQRDRARGRFEMADWRMRMLNRGSREEDITEARHEYMKLKARVEELEAESPKYEQEIGLAKARVAELDGKLREIDVNLREQVIVAPEPAIVEVLAVRPGDLVSPNQPVIRVLRAQDLWIKVYVPETELGKVRHHQKVAVVCDAYPNHRFEGTVIQVGSISEFTPRNVQSIDERRHQMFPVKVHVSDPQGVFRSGMAAQVLLPLAPAP